MKHSDIHAGSGTVVSIQDPSTGMYLDLTFTPGQTHRALHVMLNGKLRTVYARLIKVDNDETDDLVLSIRAPRAASDEPPVDTNRKPHPATLLRPEDETRAGRAAPRAEGAKAPHPATVQSPEDYTRAANEALRGSRPVKQEVARIQKDEEDSMEALEPVMTAEELGDLYADAQARKEGRARMQGSEAPGLQTLVASDVDLAALDSFPMSEDEVAKLHDDAKALRSREEPVAEADHDLVEMEAKKKGKGKGR